MTNTELIDLLHRTGHLDYPDGQEQDRPTDSSGRAKLTLADKCVQEAVRSWQSLDANFDNVAMAMHQRPCTPDGDVGPATLAMVSIPRCEVPDYQKPSDVAAAVGRGNWPRCHDVGDFHAVSVRIKNSPPSHLAPVFDEVKRRTIQAYAELGLLIHFDGRSPVQLEMSFVSRSSGWIGLAQVVNGASCSSNNWCQFLASYRGGNSSEAVAQQWTTLIKHELGHNCGMGHSRGGVMNPSIVNGLPISWKGDPSHGLLTSRFGGEPVPTGGPDSDDFEIVLAKEYAGGKLVKFADVATGDGSWPV